MATYLITGANRGIGYEYCRQLRSRGDDVIAVCRAVSTELQALDVRIEAGIDIASEQAVSDLVQRLGDLQLDVLINNAGILERV
ncbi:MAG: SDR family NAD(P)-dependent oxidoreductase, partial [Cyanobacteria bacterium P01_H01_bin.58]